MLTREMKDSGVEWIGEIPKLWEVVPSNLFFYNSSEKINTDTNEKVEQLTASQKYGVISQRKYMELETQTPVQKQNLDDLKRVNKNDFVISLRSFEGGIEIAQESGGITPAYTVLKEKTKKTYSRFYMYLFKSNMYIQALRSTVLDTIRDGKSIKYTHFSMVPIVLPPIKDQERITEKLDKLISNIEKIINETKQSIEEFKKYKQSIITEKVTKGLDPNVDMKHSKIKWIDKVPMHWNFIKLNRVTQSYSGGTPSRNESEYWINGIIPWVSSGEVNKGYIYATNEKITIKGLENSSAKLFPSETVLVALNGQGKTKGMSAILKIEATTNQSLVGFICDKDKLDYRYLNYIFIASYEFNRSYFAGGNKRDGIAATDLRKKNNPNSTS